MLKLSYVDDETDVDEFDDCDFFENEQDEDFVVTKDKKKPKTEEIILIDKNNRFTKWGILLVLQEALADIGIVCLIYFAIRYFSRKSK